MLNIAVSLLIGIKHNENEFKSSATKDALNIKFTLNFISHYVIYLVNRVCNKYIVKDDSSAALSIKYT